MFLVLYLSLRNSDSTQKTENCSSTSLTLEKFMVKLCAHHQKQFLFVLNSLCTEEPFMNSKSQSACSLDVKDADLEDRNNCVSECTKETSVHSTSKETSINTPAGCSEPTMETCPREVAYNLDVLEPQVMLDIGGNSVTDISVLNNCSHSPNHQEGNLVKNHILHIKPTEENSQLLQPDETGCVKSFEPLQTDFSDCCVLSDSNLTFTPVTSAQEAEFLINLPKCADKENAQCISPRQASLDKDSDCKLKQNSVHAVVVTKLGNHLNHFENFKTLNDSAVPTLHKIRSHDNIKHSKTAKRCKNTPSFRKSDCDNQCDVVYISEPITTQYHFQHQKSYLCSRNTARKSTRGYPFNDECCQLSTVRTLVRSSRVEDKGNCALRFSEALIIPEGVITETLPLTDDVSLVHSEETCMATGTSKSLLQSDTIPYPCICKESDNTDDISSMVEHSVNAVSDSLLAVFSVVHDGNNNPSFSGPHSSNEILQKKPLDMLVDQGNIPLDVSNNHHDLPEKHPSGVTCSSPTLNEEHHATRTSLDVDLFVSLKDKTVLSEHNNANEAAANELVSSNTRVQQIHVPLENSSADPSISCSVSPVSNRSETTDVVPTKLGFFPCEKMSSTLEDHDILHSVQNGIQIKPFEGSSNDCLQPDLNSYDRLNNLERNITKIVEECSVFTIAKKTEEDHIGQQNSYKCAVHKESIKKIEIDRKEAPSVDNCSAMDNQIDRISTEDINNVIDTCAKIGQPDDLQFKDSSVKNQDVQCPTLTSFECANIDLDKSSQTKMLNGENHSNLIKLDIFHSLLPGQNMNDKITMLSKKKLKKSPVPSDRRLRSRETQTNACKKKKASLHIQISQLPSTKASHRSVKFSTECTTQYRHLMQNHSNFEESLDCKNLFSKCLNDQFAEEKALLSDKMFRNTISSSPKRLENVSIHFEISSETRTVYFCSKNKNCIKVEEEELSCSPSVLNNSCPYKFKQFIKPDPADASVSLAQTRSKTKCAALNSLTEVKEKLNKAVILPRLSAENTRQPLKCKKSIAFSNMDISLDRSKDKELVRPKFLDWCFEEESQERISTFNNKYSSVHNNWIPLEKDVSVGPKSKNKADKLKEIWKTKKRVRKTKTVEETQRHSPMQMLFKNSFKSSDICRWFMETTETKSLVIVKKINTRLPEEHQLPVPPLQKYPSPSLYPHILQAKRLKKHLKKFASVYPARNNATTQNALNKLENKVQLVETLKSSVKGASDSKCSESKVITDKATSARILRKYSHFREKIHLSAPLSKKSKSSMAQTSSVKKDLLQNTRRLPSKLNSQTAANPPVCKPVVTEEKQKARKRPKDYHSTKPSVQTSKRRKTENKQELGKNRHSIIKDALPTKQPGSVSKSQAAKRQEVKSQVDEATILKKGKTKTAMQKKPNKTRLAIRRCQTRSSKLRLVSPVLSEQRITRVSQPWMKELHGKMCTGSNTAKKAQLVEKRMNRSRTDTSTQSRR